MIETKPQSVKTAIYYLELVLLLLLVLFMPTQAAYQIKKGHNAIYIGCGDVVTALTFMVWFLTLLVTRTPSGEWRLRTIKFPPAALWIFVLAAAVSGLNSPSIYRGLAEAEGGIKAMLGDERIRNAIAEFAQYVLYFLVAYTLLRNLTEDPRRRNTALGFLFVLSTGVLLLGLKQYFTEPDPMKVSATFGSKNIYGGFWVMLAPIVLVAGLATESRALKVWAYTVVFAATFTMLSGGALLALAIVLPLTAFRWKPRSGYAVAGVLAVGLVLVSALGMRTCRQNMEEFAQVRDSEGDIKKEYIEWQADVNMLADHFLTGIGLGNYQLNIGEYYTYLPNKEKMPFDCNNQYLVIASSLGIFGLIAFMNVLCSHLRRASSAHLQSDDPFERALALGCWGALCGFAITNVWHALLVRGTGMVFIFLLAIVGTFDQPKRPTEEFVK